MPMNGAYMHFWKIFSERNFFEISLYKLSWVYLELRSRQNSTTGLSCFSLSSNDNSSKHTYKLELLGYFTKQRNWMLIIESTKRIAYTLLTSFSNY